MDRWDWLEHGITILVVLACCFVLGSAAGFSLAKSTVQEDCNILGKFRVQEAVYICHKEK